VEETSDSGLEVGWYAELHSGKGGWMRCSCQRYGVHITLLYRTVRYNHMFQRKKSNNKKQGESKEIYFIVKYYVEC